MADLLNKLNGANYVTVKVTDDAITNGNNLLAAYALAKTKTLNSPTLRSIVVLPPALYDLGTQSLTLDNANTDIIGSTSNKGSHYIRSNVGVANKGVIIQNTDTVRLINLTIENSNVTYTHDYGPSDPCVYCINTTGGNTYIQNVEFKSNPFFIWSTRLQWGFYGTYIDCVAGDRSFGHGAGGPASGTFINCTAGDSSFGYLGGIAYGTFTNCTGGIASFGYDSGYAAYTTLKNCTGGNSSFLAGPYTGSTLFIATFINCTGGDNSFGGALATNNCTFINCIGGEGSFQGTIASKPIIRNCFGGNSGLRL